MEGAKKEEKCPPGKLGVKSGLTEEEDCVDCIKGIPAPLSFSFNLLLLLSFTSPHLNYGCRENESTNTREISHLLHSLASIFLNSLQVSCVATKACQ